MPQNALDLYINIPQDISICVGRSGAVVSALSCFGLFLVCRFDRFFNYRKFSIAEIKV